MSDKPCHYDVLGLERGAGARAVKTAYRKLALHWHPVSERSSGDGCSLAAAAVGTYVAFARDFLFVRHALISPHSLPYDPRADGTSELVK